MKTKFTTYSFINHYFGINLYLSIVFSFFSALFETLMVACLPIIFMFMQNTENITTTNKFAGILNTLFPLRLETMLIFLFVVGCLTSLCFYIAGSTVAKIRGKFEYTIRKDLYHKIFLSKWVYSSKYKHNVLYNNLTQEVNRASQTVYLVYWISLLSSITFLYIILACFISVKFTCTVVLSLGTIAFFMKKYIAKSKKDGKDLSTCYSQLFDNVSQYLHNLKYIKQNKLEKLIYNNFDSTINDLNVLKTKEFHKATTIKAIYDPIVILMLISTIFVALMLKLKLEIFIVLIVILYRLVPRTNQFQVFMHELLISAPSISNICIMLNDPHLKDHSNSIIHNNTTGSLCIESLEFKYDTFKLKINQFKASPHNITSLIGETGCGKSTFVDLICGLHQNYTGSIKMPKSVKTFEDIKYITQESVLFNDTISNNITLGKKHSLEEIQKYCKLLNLHEFIMSLKNNYDHTILNNGSEFSGGQKQRLMIARALINQPKILIMDEATSALDPQTEQNLLKLLNKIKKEFNIIIISIAHRPSTILNSDYVYMLENGKIISEGPLEKLRASTQFNNYINGMKAPTPVQNKPCAV